MPIAPHHLASKFLQIFGLVAPFLPDLLQRTTPFQGHLSGPHALDTILPLALFWRPNDTHLPSGQPSVVLNACGTLTCPCSDLYATSLLNLSSQSSNNGSHTMPRASKRPSRSGHNLPLALFRRCNNTHLPSGQPSVVLNLGGTLTSPCSDLYATSLLNLSSQSSNNGSHTMPRASKRPSRSGDNLPLALFRRCTDTQLPSRQPSVVFNSRGTLTCPCSDLYATSLLNLSSQFSNNGSHSMPRASKRPSRSGDNLPLALFRRCTDTQLPSGQSSVVFNSRGTMTCPCSDLYATSLLNLSSQSSNNGSHSMPRASKRPSRSGHNLPLALFRRCTDTHLPSGQPSVVLNLGGTLTCPCSDLYATSLLNLSSQSSNNGSHSIPRASKRPSRFGHNLPLALFWRCNNTQMPSGQPSVVLKVWGTLACPCSDLYVTSLLNLSSQSSNNGSHTMPRASKRPSRSGHNLPLALFRRCTDTHLPSGQPSVVLNLGGTLTSPCSDLYATSLLNLSSQSSNNGSHTMPRASKRPSRSGHNLSLALFMRCSDTHMPSALPSAVLNLNGTLTSPWSDL